MTKIDKKIKYKNLDRYKWLDKYRTKWSTCQLCPLHKTRSNVVLYRGHPRPEVLFIGEAPGRNEDANGIPFIGRAGKLLDKFLKEVECHLRPLFMPPYGITNTISCIPYDQDHNLRKPSTLEAIACNTRLLELVEKLDPLAIVYLGRTAEKLTNDDISHHRCTLFISHPAYWLRTGEEKGLPYKESVQTLTKFFRSLYT